MSAAHSRGGLAFADVAKILAEGFEDVRFVGDEAGRPLDGSSKHTIHFEKDAMPPARAFWSVTLYDQDGFQIRTASIGSP
jgi:hypothetical protein